ncbi:type VI secretion system membrane subunit TssM [Chitinimonas arctica]|uniref:Type VI secretion system membrane subunit TssM n=1 Tax=Chitinimonas arctica TaxID=2594795 RepID=A0A516SH64_9NEIS|nr:type VI secretion system membrane subunit TssM [Chitinimonas arctica]QDQ27504.1 type VI secretion system membrane subunit TssM [Chitinimonas arctica]
MKRLFRLLFNRWVLVALGFLCLAGVIWFVGPLVAIAEWRPLAPVWARLALLGGLILAYLLYLGIGWWRRWRAGRALESGLVAQGKQVPAGQDSEENQLLQQRFSEALGILRQARAQEQGNTSGWRKLLGRFDSEAHLYQLPWYVIVGAPGTGKTTALVNSGLRFPLAEHFPSESVRGVGGTRNCSWLFTDRAVLLDTAGRYSTQASDKVADSKEWGSFLRLLTKHRPRQPINGVMLTISAADLLQSSSFEIELQASALRSRINELRDDLQIDFPIYVLVTKVDLIAGFGEYFDELSAEERTQVWGMTLPRGQTTAPREQAAVEFDSLIERLHGRLVERLERERDVQRRTQLCHFPQRFGVLREPLLEFLNLVFAPTPYQATSMLRGVYFTSGTQEGQPLDPLFGQYSRGQLDRPAGGSQGSAGRGFFISRLLNDVIFAEAHLAGTNRSWRRRRALLTGGGYAGLAVAACVAVAAWGTSYVRNSHYVEQVGGQLPAARTKVEGLVVGQDGKLAELIPVLHAVRDVTETSGVRRDAVPLSLRFGLYQGDKLDAAAKNAYERLLQDALLPRIVYRLEGVLRESQHDTDLLYEALKAYIMLKDSKHFDAEAFKAWVMVDWESNLAREVTAAQRNELEAHLDALLSRGTLNSPVAMDEKLIADARDILLRKSLPERVYGRLKRIGVNGVATDFKISEVAGPSAMLVFTRASGQSLSKGVPGFFTVRGYYHGFLKEIAPVATAMVSEERWVLGNQQSDAQGKPLPAAELSKVSDAVRRIYLEEYANTWDQFVKDVRLVHFGNLSQSVQAARVLSATDSPLLALLRGVVRETSLAQYAETAKNTVDKASDSLREKKDGLLKLIGQSNTQQGPGVDYKMERVVDDRFEGLRRMVQPTTPNGPAPIDASIALLNEFYTFLTATETAVQGGVAAPQSDLPTRLKAEAARMPEPLHGVLDSLSSTGVSQALGVTRQNLSANLGASVGEFCSRAVVGRYPFNRNAAAEVRPEDFGRLFTTGGVLDDFFQKNLAQYVDTSRRPWTFRQVGEGNMGDASGALIQFQRAATIRDVFFQNGSRVPALRLDFKPVEMDANVIQAILDVDGQLIRYNHGPQVPVTINWPGPRGGHQVRLQFTGPGGAEIGGMSFEGGWALFRALDKAQITPSNQPERFRVSFDIGGKSIQYEVTASSVQNPFRMAELTQFSCPAKL